MVWKIVATVILTLLAVYVVWYVLGWISLFFYTLVVAAIAAAVAYAAFQLFKLTRPAAAKKVPKEFRLGGTSSKSVYVFRDEPSLKDLVKMHDELHVAQLELAGDVFPVEKDTGVIILEDSGKECVKIRLKTKDSKKKERIEGWIDRSNLVSEPRRLSG